MTDSPNTAVLDPDVERKLRQEIADTQLQRFGQIDGVLDCAGDILDGDSDGDALIFSVTYEPMESPGKHMPLRILIHEAADREDTRRLLLKALDALDPAFDTLEVTSGNETATYSNHRAQ